MGRYTETHNEKNVRWIAHVARSANATYGENQNTFLLWRLQIEVRRQVEKPTLALIETTAHPKRCCFGLSIQKFGSLGRAPTDQIPLAVPSYSIFLMLAMNLAASSACFSAIPGAANVKMITTFFAASTSTLQSIVVPLTWPVPPWL